MKQPLPDPMQQRLREEQIKRAFIMGWNNSCTIHFRRTSAKLRIPAAKMEVFLEQLNDQDTQERCSPTLGNNVTWMHSADPLAECTSIEIRFRLEEPLPDYVMQHLRTKEIDFIIPSIDRRGCSACSIVFSNRYIWYFFTRNLEILIEQVVAQDEEE